MGFLWKETKNDTPDETSFYFLLWNMLEMIENFPIKTGYIFFSFSLFSKKVKEKINNLTKDYAYVLNYKTMHL